METGGSDRTGGMKQRFTLDGSDSLEQRLEQMCWAVLRRVERAVPRMEGLVLAGGYGRGEGGVLRTETGDEPYNDLEFYLFLPGPGWINEWRHGAAIRRAAHELSGEAGVEVEIQICSRSRLERSPVTMFSYDLVQGHRILQGDPFLLSGCEHHRAAQNIPLSEATRLLMNRCSGLLFAKDQLGREPFTGENADFVGRNIAKAQLALGDAVLAAFGLYHWSCRKRHQRLEKLHLEELQWLGRVQREHLEGVEFKLHPHRSQAEREPPAERWRAIADLAKEVWLWLESRRLGERFTDVRAYALSRGSKWPESSRMRKVLAQVRGFGPGGLLKLQPRRHPRERLLIALAVLLWESRLADDPALLNVVQKELGTKGADFSGLVRSYHELWERFR